MKINSIRKNKYIKITTGICLGIIICIFILSKVSIKDEFDFTLRYGVGGKNILDTFEGTYQKDLIPGVAKTKMELNQKEKNVILEKMLEMDIFNYPSSYPKTLSVEPKGVYNLYIKYKGKTKGITWSSDNMPHFEIDKDGKFEYKEEGKYEKIITLFDLKAFIVEIIENREEYKKLPQRNGAYL